MVTALILILSGILIGAGVSVIWRDVKKTRRAAFVSRRDQRPAMEPDVEITITPAESEASEARPRAAKAGDSAPITSNLAPAAADTDPDANEPLPLPTFITDARIERLSIGASAHEQQWTELQPAIAAGVDQVNAVLAPTGLSIGPPGDASWSYKNRGYGGYRRVLLHGHSIGWLRLELASDGQLNASVKAHEDKQAGLNSSASTRADGLDAVRAGDLLSQCMKLATSYAALKRLDGPEAAREASETAWSTIDGLVTSALKAANGALGQAGGRLVPLGHPQWDSDSRRHRMTLVVEADGQDVARMHIERLQDDMEVAVGVRDPRLIDLGRRRRAPLDGITVHALAELIAGCAWPAIARFREVRSPA